MKKKSSLALLLFFGLTPIIYSQSDKRIEKEIDIYLSSHFKTNEPGYAILVSKGGDILYNKAIGLANIEHNVANKSNTVFRIGSITKQFTAIAILQLAQSGKLSLQDSIQQYIPDYPSAKYKITLEHLLTHTSGIKEFLAIDHPDPFALRRDFTPKEIIDHFKNEPLEFEPGSKWAYSNSGYILLGFIIERVSAKPYAQYMSENIFKPAGMNDTYCGNHSELIPNRAEGYVFEGSHFRNSEYLSMTIPYAAGGVLSTVEDLLKWHKALISGKLVNKELLQKAFTSYKLSDGSAANYGYGWFIKEEHGSKAIDHSGRISGFNTTALYFPDETIYVVVLSNLEDTREKQNSSQTAIDLAGIAMRKKPVASITIDKETRDGYKGHYALKSDPSRVVTVTEENEKLFIQETNKWKAELFATAPSLFILKHIKPAATLQFIKDDKGKVISFVVTQGQVFEWNKIK